tara:strand:- start:4824 stop:5624 length:801 start_codon:yes stop_codon:yes gene_type:complete
MKSIYFGGGAWSCAFFIGVIKALEEKYGKELNKKFRFGGDSIGAYFALGLTLGYTSEEIKDIFYEFSSNAVNDGVFNFLKNSEYHELLLNKIIIDKNAYKIAEKNNLEVGISRLFNDHDIYKKWENNEHLKKCIHASLHVPFYCKYQNKFDRKIAFDGGFFLKNEVLEKYDITVGRGEFYDISMTPTLCEILFPPDKFKIEKFILDGYNKTLHIGNKNDREAISNYFIYNFFIHYVVFMEIIFNLFFSSFIKICSSLFGGFKIREL